MVSRVPVPSFVHSGFLTTHTQVETAHSSMNISGPSVLPMVDAGWDSVRSMEGFSRSLGRTEREEVRYCFSP